ncbi:MAG TPA: HEAT repeat domain-containing protein [Gallionellaceae bacterium]
MTGIKVSSIIAEFCEAAIEKGDFESTPKLDRELHSRMAKSISRLNSLGEAGLRSIEALLKHQSPYVRSWAAAELLANGNEKAIPVLIGLTNQGGLIATSSRMVLQEYEAGMLRSPFGTNAA